MSTHPGTRRIVAATGLALEASIARAAGVRCVTSGGDAGRLAAMLHEELSRGARAILSFGIAGALVDGMGPGTWLIGRAVVTSSECLLADAAWSAALAQCLPGARLVNVAGSDTLAAMPDGKRRVHEQTGAVAVDMESHVVAQVALARAVPFAVFRVVSDPVDRALPEAARVGLDRRGRPAVRAVLRALAGSPRQAVPLARTALDAGAALRALSAGRRRLGPGLAYPDLGELLVDVA